MISKVNDSLIEDLNLSLKITLVNTIKNQQVRIVQKEKKIFPRICYQLVGLFTKIPNNQLRGKRLESFGFLSKNEVKSDTVDKDLAKIVHEVLKHLI